MLHYIRFTISISELELLYANPFTIKAATEKGVPVKSEVWWLLHLKYGVVINILTYKPRGHVYCSLDTVKGQWNIRQVYYDRN